MTNCKLIEHLKKYGIFNMYNEKEYYKKHYNLRWNPEKKLWYWQGINKNLPSELIKKLI